MSERESKGASRRVARSDPGNTRAWSVEEAWKTIIGGICKAKREEEQCAFEEKKAVE